MARKRGRCRRGRRLRAAIPHGHYKTVTLVAGLRLSGLVAQKAFDRPINAASFEQWVEKSLAPTLSKGDIVVMDNLSSHKGPKVEQLIKAVGAELRYLPPYSPDMNPIEKAYSKLKAFLRHGPSRHLVDVRAGGCLEPIGQHFQEKPARQVDQRFAAQMIALLPALGLDSEAFEVGQDPRQGGAERGQASSIRSDALPSL